jgi:hypothetical protein
MKKLTPRLRKRLYEAGLAAIGIAAVYGLVDGEQAAAWALLLAPVLGVARANVPDTDR